MLQGGVWHDNKPLGEDRPYAGSYSGGDAGYLRMADHYCIYAESNLVHSVPNSAVRYDMDDYELQKDILIKPNATLRDVVELCMNGDISYADAREWCMENDISLGQFDRWLYGALRKSDNPARVEPKEPWPYRVVAGINRVLEILLNSILETNY